MIITTEKNLKDFEFWSGAEERVILLTWDEFETIEKELEELYPEGLTETALNDLFWFDFDFIAGMIGETEESIIERE